jgi:ferredoxin-like protein FixX
VPGTSTPGEPTIPEQVDVDACLGLNRYEVDEEHAHIELTEDPPLEEFLKLLRLCPAGLYRVDEKAQTSFDYAGCLECGSCRIACGDTIVKRWENPRPGKGISYRYG